MGPAQRSMRLSDEAPGHSNAEKPTMTRTLAFMAELALWLVAGLIAATVFLE